MPLALLGVVCRRVGPDALSSRCECLVEIGLGVDVCDEWAAARGVT